MKNSLQPGPVSCMPGGYVSQPDVHTFVRIITQMERKLSMSGGLVGPDSDRLHPLQESVTFQTKRIRERTKKRQECVADWKS